MLCSVCVCLRYGSYNGRSLCCTFLFGGSKNDPNKLATCKCEGGGVGWVGRYWFTRDMPRQGKTREKERASEEEGEGKSSQSTPRTEVSQPCPDPCLRPGSERTITWPKVSYAVRHG
ncbi:hypothetical protein ACOMHN_065435 [Nucella lapillus]